MMYPYMTLKDETEIVHRGEYDDCISVFLKENRNATKIVQGIIKYEDGTMNIIKDTDWFSIPETNKIKNELESGNTALRGKEKRDELLSSCVDIKMFRDKNDDENLYYFVGIKGSGMNSKVQTAANIRKVETVGENSYFEKILPLMNVLFVHNEQLTVYPFPFKYLREYVNMYF